MKRSARLAALSREHHPALVLAKRIAGADEAQRQCLCAELPEHFATALEPHFADEEKGLLPRLAALGCTELVDRTLDEHRLLRSLAAAAGAGDASALLAFGLVLHDHVRFEERELFAAAEARLDAAWLACDTPDFST